MKNINSIDINTINTSLIIKLKEQLNEKQLKELNMKILNKIVKKFNMIKNKNYIVYYILICILREEDPNLDNEIIEIIAIIFYDFLNFLSKLNKITETISYPLLLNNILTIFNVTKNFNPNIHTIKDKKWDLWNKYVLDVCDNYLDNYINTKTKVYIELNNNNKINKIKIKTF